MRLFSTEQVSKYHPDKYADQISDAVLDACLAQDPLSRVACECLVKGTAVILAGEITTKAKFDVNQVVQRVAKKLGYEVNHIEHHITMQSPEIAGGVREGDDLGAGDQGMMYGYATAETSSLLPFGFHLANRIIKAIEDDVEFNPRTPFKGDAKCQVTVDLDAAPRMDSVKKILVSACHKESISLAEVRYRVTDLLEGLGIDTDKIEVIINPAGSWTLGGPAADCGLTGRKIVCDQYGGYCPVGGGAFSGKDPSKVDRSGAYMARKIACDIVKNFGVKTAEVQIAYAIGQNEPMSVCITLDEEHKDLEKSITLWAITSYNLRPASIIKALDLLKPNYEERAEGCHFFCR